MTEKKDKILFETTVALKKDDYDTLLTLTEKQLLFQKKKGLIQKKNKVVKTIEISDIKIIKGKVHIERQEEKVILHLKDNNFEFICSDKKESKRCLSDILVFINSRVLLQSKEISVTFILITFKIISQLWDKNTNIL